MNIDDFPFWSTMPLRYCDTDRQGHINNAIFVTLLEAGRVDLLYDPMRAIIPAGHDFAIVKLSLEFRAELRWPGEVKIGTAVTSIGRSSVHLHQRILQDGRHAAEAETISVLVCGSTGRSAPISDEARTALGSR